MELFFSICWSNPCGGHRLQLKKNVPVPMKNHGHKPDTVSYRVLAGGLARNAAALVDGYSEAGLTEKAFNLVLKLHKQGFLVRKTSCSLCKRGYVKKAQIKHVGYEQESSVIKEAVRDRVGSVGPSSEILVRIAESLSLNSNMEILIEAVALEKLKENAEQAEITTEIECIDKLIALGTHMHRRLVLKKKSQTCSPVLIPPDFICPLSLRLITDPVIVASGRTYEQAVIKKWIDLGINVCPKTRKTLVHTLSIPNYTMKALIANWCESNNVKLPDPMESTSLNQVYPLRATEVKKLVEEMKSTSTDTQRAAAAQLRLLSKQTLRSLRLTRARIGRSGTIQPLVDLLGNGTPRGKKDATSALFNLSLFHGNKARIVQAGMVDKAVVLLANVATIPEGRTAIAQEGGIPRLVEVVELSSARGKEHAAAALLYPCTCSSRSCSVVLQEGAVPPLVALSRSSIPRAKEKAQVLLSYFRNQRHGNAESD
ncbi:hypothetical protein GOBAR_AA12278 [Gossypium barbadense]|uniref:RING-type E3 ubiquitin transferase n=1 Tax=Gossypium barbadense TaxID=3634 RepID=A0A2P5XYJ7_GOSBA|nr:hypothetical protein GOBAR_AA12278 [Gossypium barbadense]